ncbi:MAG: tetratricopeptide repeat protein [Desulfosudaceae bacterium]
MLPNRHQISLLHFIPVMLLIGIIGWLSYADSLQAPFVFDDIKQIVENPHIRMKAITPGEIRETFKSHSANRPFAYLTFGLNYHAGEYRVFGYHLVNLLIHLATALLVFIITRQTRRLLRTDQTAPVAVPLLAALLWLVNPLHVQSITYLVQRMNALATLFYLLSLSCYIQARVLQKKDSGGIPATILFTVCLAAAFLGLASKETAATLPVIILAYEWYFFQDLDRSWPARQRWWMYAAALLVLGLGLIYMDVNPMEKIFSMYDNKSFTPLQRLLTEPRVVLYYLSLLFFPHPARLKLVYDFPLSTGPLCPLTTLAALLALAALVVFIVLAARRHRLLSFALLWFLANLAIESSFLGLALIFEHRAYLPSVFPFIAVTCLLAHHLKPSRIMFPLAGALIIIGAVWTHQRNEVWSGSISLWSDNAAKTPANSQVTNNLGMAYFKAGKNSPAKKAFEAAIGYDPASVRARNNLGMILIEQGEAEAALPHFEKAIQLEPRYYNSWYNLGRALYDLNRLRQATTAFRQAVKLNPLYDKAHNNLGIALMQQDYADRALDCFRRTLEINPAYLKAYSNMGIALLRQGKTDQARRVLKKALDMDPYYLEAYNNLKRVDSLREKYGRKIDRLRNRSDRNPENPDLLFQLGKTYQEAGMTFAAITNFKKALDLRPKHLKGLNRLAELYARRQRYAEAAAAFEKMAALLPEAPVVFYNLACMRARADHPEKAVASLKKAVELGYDNPDRIKNDPDLENIRSTSYYRKLTEDS